MACPPSAAAAGRLRMGKQQLRTGTEGWQAQAPHQPGVVLDVEGKLRRRRGGTFREKALQAVRCTIRIMRGVSLQIDLLIEGEHNHPLSAEAWDTACGAAAAARASRRRCPPP